MKSIRVVSALFGVAALYDGLLGLVFLFASGSAFRWFDVPPPNHPGYVQFPAALLIIFAILFGAVARAPLRNRGLIPYGILLKVAYCGVVGYHWATSDLPGIWKPFVAFDLVFLALFWWAWNVLGRRPGLEAATAYEAGRKPTRSAERSG